MLFMKRSSLADVATADEDEAQAFIFISPCAYIKYKLVTLVLLAAMVDKAKSCIVNCLCCQNFWVQI